MAFIFVHSSTATASFGATRIASTSTAPGSAVHITAQAATKIHAARQNYPAQLVNLRAGAGAGAVLEYLPDPVVPFRGSRLFQRLCLTVHDEASVILGETLLPGRTAHGEAHAYDLYWAETEVRRADGTLLFADALRLHPGGGDNPTSIGLLGGHDQVATLYVISPAAGPCFDGVPAAGHARQHPWRRRPAQRAALGLWSGRALARVHFQGSPARAANRMECCSPRAARRTGAGPPQGLGAADPSRRSSLNYSSDNP
jgi:UreD urease accessory protein